MTGRDETTEHLPGAGAGRSVADLPPTSEMPPVAPLEQQRSGDEVAPPRPSRDSGLLRGVGLVVVVLALVGALVWGGQRLGVLPHLGNPFAAKQTDRSQPALLKSIQDLNRFVGASGNFEVIVDVQKDRKNIPDIIFSDRTLFVAAGSVDAYVDFDRINKGALQVDEQTKTVTLRLPAAQLGKPNIDHDRSYVYAESKGIINHVGDLFGGDPNRQQQLYQLAEQKISGAATASGLTTRAQDNTRKMLEGMIRSFGYTTVTITFDSP
jgi:hypothetical protein